MKIIRTSQLPIAILFSVFMVPAEVLAGADSGVYLGIGAGEAALTVKGSDPTDGDYNLDDSDVGYKLFGGYNFGYVPVIDLAVEISYVDFGTANSAFVNGNPISYEITGLNAFGLVGINLGPLGLFAKAGVISWQLDSTIGTTNNSDSGTDTAYGLGAKLQLSSYALRAEYEVYDVNSVNDLDMFSVSIVFTF